jgi:hypothetical protein
MKLPISEALLKMASNNLPDPPPDSGEPPPPEMQGSITSERPWVRAAKAVGGGALAFGVGTAAGSGAALGIQKLLGNKLTPSRLMKAGPVLGGAMGLAYNQYKARETEELRNALKSHQEQRSRSTPTNERT